MTLDHGAPASSVCPGSGKEPLRVEVDPRHPWNVCPICTRVFNLTRAGMIPRHLSHSRAARMKLS
jgi:hypothetical protein